MSPRLRLDQPVRQRRRAGLQGRAAAAGSPSAASRPTGRSGRFALDRDDVRGRLHQLPDPRLLRGLHVPRPEHPALHGYLSLFTFAMLMLVTSDNLLQLFFGWEGVGLASYLLIGFWYTKPSACAAAIKAFIVNRVGDFGLVLGIAAGFLAFDSVQYDEIFARVPEIAADDDARVRPRLRHART